MLATNERRIFLSSRLITVHQNILRLVTLYGWKTWCFTVRKEHRMEQFSKRGAKENIETYEKKYFWYYWCMGQVPRQSDCPWHMFNVRFKKYQPALKSTSYSHRTRIKWNYKRTSYFFKTIYPVNTDRKYSTVPKRSDQPTFQWFSAVFRGPLEFHRPVSAVPQTHFLHN